MSLYHLHKPAIICDVGRIKRVKIVLASQSPRRREMLAWLALPAELTHTDVDETPHDGEPPSTTAMRLAVAKVHAVEPTDNDAWILGADTVVDLNGISLGKPTDPAEACTMLRQLRERSHAVHTAIALYHPQTCQMSTRRVTSTVQMRGYSDGEIEAYVHTGDPMDKAGAYAIQNSVFRPVAHVDRCYANVVGFPLCAIAALLEAWDLTLTVNIPALCLAHFDYVCPETDIGIGL